jgi:hypothetical protein
MHFLKISTLLLAIFIMACNTKNPETTTNAANNAVTNGNGTNDAPKSNPSAGYQENASLDGRTFRLSEPGATGIVETDEYLYFKDGHFETSKSAKLGFQKAKYTCTSMGEAYNFRATLINADKSQMTWDGMLSSQGSMLQYMWMKKSGMPETKSYIANEVKK